MGSKGMPPAPSRRARRPGPRTQPAHRQAPADVGSHETTPRDVAPAEPSAEDPLALVQLSWVAGRRTPEPVDGADLEPTRYVVGTWAPTGSASASSPRGSLAVPPGRPLSRRALREAARTSSDQSRRPAPALRTPRPAARRAARGAVVAAIGALTIAAPLSGLVHPGNGTYVADQAAVHEASLHLYPSTLDALTREPVPLDDTVLAATPAAGTRALLLSSRAQTREALPGCDPDVRPSGANGQLNRADLCTLWDGTTQLRADAAMALAEFNENFRAQFGRDLCLSDGYRTLAEQQVLKARKPGLSAVPGRSNHGWGLAIDLCSRETSGQSWAWFKANAPVYGWTNPDWALPGGAGPTEPWHWEFIG